ncbi:Molybdenum cofactor sulfurase [Fulvia fulva]|uniref:Molybdenum cofactor sulfurase n=1 Tax=Passalora fulva TaxID=5499 RepID=A0A9Q8UVF8_PASFU|nr:Molybdenum cofactor sulfurase [Fulvia fulva]KAK4612327.1 Molybdenum cofactor sulfurase [Fulvia fulva]KAK4612540.1 Molybdenum cofactor sulfurase [Fulvia fulva]UJO23949.1 Molybdenum cofactor sulfurase [Fulvia fulva]WPV21646.1 Molybdenum cofactor sulfurase [Fulvia fulva]WPV36036.1 Molybdenum cofactor sulfurase [Fulvia fulva]
MADYFSGTASQERQRWACRDSKSPIEDSMDLLRLLEYPQLLGKTYLDHAGTTPWAKSLTTDFAQLMTEDLFGNPHSESDPSKLSEQKIEATRRKALEFFNCNPDDWDLIFTPNSTGAIKLVHDCFRDYAAEAGRNWWYGYHKDAHTSLVGVREGPRMHRCFRSDNEVEKWIDFRGLGGAVSPHNVQLFAYPAQSNMTGKRFPLEWSGQVRNRVRGEVYTLLDAAAYASTAQLDLSNADEAPDFVALSFYKIFGFPNLGALIVRKASSKTLESRKFFGGGTVEMVISVNDD